MTEAVLPRHTLPDRQGDFGARTEGGSAPLLVADIGGTHIRTSWHDGDRLRDLTVARWDEGADLTAQLEAVARPLAIRNACLAVAAPVVGDVVDIQNAGVKFSIRQLRDNLNLRRLLVVNDVEALARSVGAMQPGDFESLGGSDLRIELPVAVVAPGTGLGVAAWLPGPRGPHVIAGEGGHAPAPYSPKTAAALRVLAAANGLVSVEDLVSGRGLPMLDAAIKGRLEEAAAATTGPNLTADADLTPGGALDVFVEVLAKASQAYALTFGARGGVVLGGFLRHIAHLLRALNFRERFTEHPRRRDWLESVPLVVDGRSDATMNGAYLLLDDNGLAH